MKLPRSRPCWRSCAIHAASSMSVFRPGRALMCRAFTTRTWAKWPSRIWKTGFQYWPVLSMATWVQPASTSQSQRVRSAPVVVPKDRSSFVTCPAAPSRRRHAVMLSLCTSRPPQMADRISMASLLQGGRGWRGVHKPSTLLRVLPLAGRHSVWCQRNAQVRLNGRLTAPRVSRPSLATRRAEGYARSTQFSSVVVTGLDHVD
jgi:hypothetical protein